MQLKSNKLRSIIRHVLLEAEKEPGPGIDKASKVDIGLHPKDQKEGDRFRGWVNDNKTKEEIAALYPRYADKTLGRSGKFKNSYVKLAWEKYGQEFLKDMPRIDINVGRLTKKAYPKNKEEGDAFRRYVNKNYPKYAKNQNLDMSGDHDNSYVKRAWDRYGDEFLIQNPRDKEAGTKLSEKGLQDLLKSVDKYKNTEIEIINKLPAHLATGIVNGLPELMKGKQVVLGKGSSKLTPTSETIKWCAEWVNKVSTRGGGYAWTNHAGAKVNGFKDISESDKIALAKAFTMINKKHGSFLGGKGTKKAPTPTLKKIASKAILGPGQVVGIPLGSIVGLYHGRTGFFCQAFYHNATGIAVGDKSYKFSNLDTNLGPLTPKFETVKGEPWNKSMMGKNIEFKWNKEHNGVVFNSHIGVVAARIDGRSIIFHNIDGRIYMTPLKQLKGGEGDAIVWFKPPAQDATPKKTKPDGLIATLTNKFSNLFTV
jgi:hypothetical protein